MINKLQNSKSRNMVLVFEWESHAENQYKLLNWAHA